MRGSGCATLCWSTLFALSLASPVRAQDIRRANHVEPATSTKSLDVDVAPRSRAALTAKLAEEQLYDVQFRFGQPATLTTKEDMRNGPRVRIPAGETATIKDQSQRPFVTSAALDGQGGAIDRKLIVQVFDEGTSIDVTVKRINDDYVLLDAKVRFEGISNVGQEQLAGEGELAETTLQTVEAHACEKRLVRAVRLGEVVRLSAEKPQKKSTRPWIIDVVVRAPEAAPLGEARPAGARPAELGASRDR